MRADIVVFGGVSAFGGVGPRLSEVGMTSGYVLDIDRAFEFR